MEHALIQERAALIVNRNIPLARERNILDRRVCAVNFHVIAVAAARPVPN